MKKGISGMPVEENNQNKDEKEDEGPKEQNLLETVKEIILKAEQEKKNQPFGKKVKKKMIYILSEIRWGFVFYLVYLAGIGLFFNKINYEKRHWLFIIPLILAFYQIIIDMVGRKISFATKKYFLVTSVKYIFTIALAGVVNHYLIVFRFKNAVYLILYLFICRIIYQRIRRYYYKNKVRKILEG